MSAEAETFEALERLERALVATDHPLVGALRPGTSRVGVDEVTEPLGLRLPDDAAALWRWHDGITASFTATRGRIRESECFPGGAIFQRLDLAVATYGATHDGFPWDDLDDWSADWFPAFGYGHGDHLWLDCSGPAGGPTSMILRHHDDYNPPDELRRRTIPIADGIDIMTALLERGIWAVHPGTGGYDLLRDPDPDLDTAWLF